MSPENRETVVLVDGFGLIFRAYYAIPTTLSTATGEQTNAIFGFASMLLDVLKNRSPEYAVIALETGRTFRHEIFPDYKGTRAAMPDDLRSQLDRVTELIDALNIPIQKKDMYEADDVIGTLSRQLADDGKDVVIITGDSDLLQLVDDNILVVLPGARRFGEFREYDLEAVHQRYGFGPQYVPDYKALVGDTSDNIPGVPGIGDKTAKKLISEFGHLDDIYAHIDDVSPTRAKNALSEGIETARGSKHLATIVRDVELDFDLERARTHEFDRDAVVDLFRQLEFRTLIAKLPESVHLKTIAERPETKDRAPSVQTIVFTESELDALISEITSTSEYAIDVETTSTDPMTADLVGIAIATAAEKSWYIPVGHDQGDQLDINLVRSKIDPVLADSAINCYAHHGKYDLQVLIRHGFTDRPLTFDTMIAAYLLGEQSLRLKDLSFNRLGIQQTTIDELIGSGKNQATMNTVSIENAAPYAMADVECTFGLTSVLKTDLLARDQLELMETIELPLVNVLMRMERTGIALDPEELAQFSSELGKRLTEIDDEVDILAGRPIAVSSNKQMATLLFDELKLTPGKKTKTGYSVDSTVLENIRHDHPVVELILEHRSNAKLKSTYADALVEYVLEDGRVHTTYNQTVAATGRLASNNPNLQNIPIRTEMGRRIRRSFIADHRPESKVVDNAVFLAADYSQMELRILAHMSGDPVLVDAFRNGEDIHRATAALVNGVNIEAVTSEQRRIAKTVNFGILYGMQAYGLSRDTGMPRADAQEFINTYWERLPKVKAFFDDVIDRGKAKGYVETLAGRRRYLPDLTSSNGARLQAAVRMAMNMPIQGTQADIIKIAMINLARSLREINADARMILQVHDELVLEVNEDQLQSVGPMVRDTMENAFKLDVPVITDMRIGQNWEDMTPFEPN